MKLIYAEGTCSLSVHILFEELSVTYEAYKVDIKKNKDVLKEFNPKGYVPALVIEDDQVLTEASAILQYVADYYEAWHLVGAQGTFERIKCQEWLSYTSSEIHKTVAPLLTMKEKLSEGAQNMFIAKAEERLGFVNEHLRDRAFLLEGLTIADMYMIAILRIVEHAGIDLSQFSRLQSYKKKMELIPSVKAAIQEEKSSPLFSDRVHFNQTERPLHS